ncbi:MAG: hypothetical protein EPO20_26075 [Betaproteobacteria bacterium]|nr:MAG: hypothetical protein EPO20_26075 [Betaproteobacteria bacterium]
MNVASHLQKIRKLEALRSRLDPMDDFELWFWSAMNAGTHAVNAALHDAKITRADDVFPAQPGVYLVPQPDSSVRPAFHPLGDVLHVGRPKIDAPIPEDVAAMMHEMELIEHHRDPCIRGERPPTPAIAQQCERALRRCLELLGKRLPGAQP